MSRSLTDQRLPRLRQWPFWVLVGFHFILAHVPLLIVDNRPLVLYVAPAVACAHFSLLGCWAAMGGSWRARLVGLPASVTYYGLLWRILNQDRGPLIESLQSPAFNVALNGIFFAGAMNWKWSLVPSAEPERGVRFRTIELFYGIVPK